MPTVELDSALTMWYEDDCFADPWRKPEVALLVHGCAESSRAWYAWVPHLARELRVIRVDQRGFGRSTVPPPGYRWSPSGFATDLVSLLDALDLDAVHVVGAKFGGAISMHFAAEYPERTCTLSVVRGIVLGPEAMKAGEIHHTQRIPDVGVGKWALETQRQRLGSEASDQQVRWWTEFMSSSDQQTCAEVAATAAGVSVAGILSRIQAPTLILTPDRCPAAPIEMVRHRQQEIAHSELMIIHSDAYHIAAAKPDECARHVLNFVKRHAKS